MNKTSNLLYDQNRSASSKEKSFVQKRLPRVNLHMNYS